MNKNKKISVIIITALIAVSIGGLSAWFFMNNKANYNTEYDENNWSFILDDANDKIQMRRVPKDQSFRVISKDNKIDFEIYDEKRNKVNAKINKDKTSFIISPNPEWNEGEDYRLIINGSTTFEYEPFKDKREIYFSIQRPDVSNAEINTNIRTDLIKLNDEEIISYTQNGQLNVGDIILRENPNGELICERIGSNNDIESAAVNDVFTDINISGKYDLLGAESELKDEKLKEEKLLSYFNDQKIVKLIYESSFFKDLSETVYYDNGFKDFDANLKDRIVVRPYYIDEKGTERLGVKIGIKFLKDEIKKKYNVNGDVTILFDISSSFEFLPNIDTRDLGNIRFDVQFTMNPRQYIYVNIKSNNELNDELIKDIYGVAESNNNFIQLCEIPIPIPGLYYGTGSLGGGLKVNIPFGFVPRLSANVDLTYKQYKNNRYSIGLKYSKEGGVETDFRGPSDSDSAVDDWELKLKGTILSSVGIRIVPTLVFELKAEGNLGLVKGSAAVIGDLGFGLEAGPYAEFIGELNLSKNKKESDGFTCSLEMGIYAKVDFKSSIKISAEGGVINIFESVKQKKTVYNTGKLDDINIGSTHIICNKRYPFLEYPKSWYIYNDKWYHYEISRYVNTKGWYDCEDDGQRYYLDPANNGEMLTGLQKIKDEDGEHYYYFKEKSAEEPIWGEYDVYSEVSDNTVGKERGFEYDKNIKKHKWISDKDNTDRKSFGSMYRGEEIPSEVILPDDEKYERRVDDRGRLIEKKQ